MIFRRHEQRHWASGAHHQYWIDTKKDVKDRRLRVLRTVDYKELWSVPVDSLVKARKIAEHFESLGESYKPDEHEGRDRLAEAERRATWDLIGWNPKNPPKRPW